MTLPCARWFAAATSLLLLAACGPKPPTAKPGEGRTVAVGSRVLLDGSQSGDAERSPLSWSWALSKAPAGSLAVLEGAATPNPSFVADVAGEYVATLVVATGTLRSDPATVTVTATAVPPVAHLVSQAARPGEVVVLDGTGSRASGGAALSFHWTVADPTGEPVVLTAADTARPSFRPVKVGSYPVALVVNDGAQDSAPAQGTVTVAEALRPPVAVVQPAATSAGVGHEVRLDAFGSYDPDGTAVTFAWTLVQKPAGSTAALDAPTANAVTLTPDVVGEFVVSLVVTDGSGEQGAPALARVSVENGAPNAVFPAPGSTWVDTDLLLDGSASTDPDGDALDFFYTVVANAPGSAQLLAGPRPGTVRFRAGAPGTYGVSLRVSDGLGHDVTLLRTVEVKAATALALVSGGGQAGAALTQLAQPVVVEARNGAQPVPNAKVRWRVHNGAVVSAQATTDAQGRAQAWIRTNRMVAPGTLTAVLEDAVPAVEVGAPFATLAGPVKLLTLMAPPSMASEPAGGVLVSVRTTDEYGNPASEPAYAQLPIQLTLREAVTAAFDTAVAGGVGVLQGGGGTFTVSGTLVDGKFDILVKETRKSNFQVWLERPAGSASTLPLQLAGWYTLAKEDAEGGPVGGAVTGSPQWKFPVLPQAPQGRRAFRVEASVADQVGNVATALLFMAGQPSVQAARVRYVEQLSYASAVDPVTGCKARPSPRTVVTDCVGCAETELAPLEVAPEPAGCDGRSALPPTGGTGFASRTLDTTGYGNSAVAFSLRSAPHPFLPAQPASWAVDDVRVEVLLAKDTGSLGVSTAVFSGPATRVAFSQPEYGNVVFTDGYCGSGRPSVLAVTARLLDAVGNIARTAEPVLLRFNVGQGLAVAGVATGTLKGLPGTQQVDVELPAQPSPNASFGVNGDARAVVLVASTVPITNATVSLADPVGAGLQLPSPVALTFQDLTCHNNGNNKYWADTTGQGTHTETQALRACEAEYGPGQCVATGGRTFTTTAFSTNQVCVGKTRHQSRAWYFSSVNDTSCGGGVSGAFTPGDLGTLGFDAATSCQCGGVSSVPAPVTPSSSFVVVGHSIFNWN